MLKQEKNTDSKKYLTAAVGKEWQPRNPHDRFTRKTVGNPIYAGDFLKNYANPELAEFVDLDNLKIGP
ncbi:MAG: Rpn family recombination-promoting nuclease/putative transposase, partial [Planctomycetaceae bacterium]|nr:Rpn family recombination-promoting nuclease/putative transposase [Planctomycetaceae bacterium]